MINIAVDTSISSQRVARELTQIFEWPGKPKTIRVDNGPEFLALAEWCKELGIELKFIQPAKPNQNAFVESFIEPSEMMCSDNICLKTSIKFETTKFIWKYNNVRPHDSLGNITPRAFLLKYGKLSATQSRP